LPGTGRKEIWAGPKEDPGCEFIASTGWKPGEIPDRAVEKGKGPSVSSWEAGSIGMPWTNRKEESRLQQTLRTLMVVQDEEEGNEKGGEGVGGPP